LQRSVLASLNHWIERLSVSPSTPILRRAALRLSRLYRITEAEDDCGALLTFEAKRLSGLLRIRHAVRARDDAVVPGRQHHVLHRTPDVVPTRALGDDRNNKLRPAHVARRVDGLCQPLLYVRCSDEQELPRLPILRAASETPRIDDSPGCVVRDRPIGVAPSVAFAGDGEEGVHWLHRMRCESVRRTSLAATLRPNGAPLVAARSHVRGRSP